MTIHKPQTIQYSQYLIDIQELPILESVEEEDEDIEEVDDGVNMKTEEDLESNSLI